MDIAVTDEKKKKEVLKIFKDNLEKRLDKMQQVGVKNYKEYNTLAKKKQWDTMSFKKYRIFITTEFSTDTEIFSYLTEILEKISLKDLGVELMLLCERDKFIENNLEKKKNGMMTQKNFLKN